LPWRRNPTPYQVLVSEVMLQQTQVNRVILKYNEFLQEFPSLEALANANNRDVLRVWSGLGYNRRALWLKEAAKEIVKLEKFPQSVEHLRKLKGIGPYTSKSILIFAFNADLAAVDTNIRRVLIAAGFATREMSPSQIQRIADEMVLEGRASDWHNALMDYGSEVLTSSSTGIPPLTSQSCFEGSNRQIRGAILRLLTYSQSMSHSDLIQRLELEKCNNEQISQTIEQLIQENIIEETSYGRYMITN